MPYVINKSDERLYVPALGQNLDPGQKSKAIDADFAAELAVNANLEAHQDDGSAIEPLKVDWSARARGTEGAEDLAGAAQAAPVVPEPEPQAETPVPAPEPPAAPVTETVEVPAGEHVVLEPDQPTTEAPA